MDLIATIAQTPGAQAAAKAALKARRLYVRGSQGSSTAFFSAAMAQRTERSIVLVVAHLDDADEVCDELTGAGVDTVRFPALEVLPGESSVSLELFAERVGVVRRLAAGKPPRVLVCPIQSLMQPVPGAKSLDALVKTVRTGQRLDPQEFVRWLDGAGYERTETIEEPGEFAMRGGIVDVFPATGSGLGAGGAPVRCDFFGDTVDRITEIDLDTMGSDRAVEAVEIVCASLDRVFAHDAPNAAGTVKIDATGGTHACSMLEYMDSSAIVLLHEPLEVTEQGRGYFERLTDSRMYGPPVVLKLLQERFACFVEVSQFPGARLGTETEIELPVQPLAEVPHEAGEAVKEIAALARGGEGVERHGVTVFCQNEGELSRFQELLAEHAPEAKGLIGAQVQYVHRGFVLETGSDGGGATLVCIPYHELLHRYESRRRSASRGRTGAGDVGGKIKSGRAIDTFLGFGFGDYVVHRDHGIALFKGLIAMKPREVKRDEAVVLPSERPKKKDRRAARPGGPGHPEADPDEGMEEYLTLEFAARSILYVPTSKIDQVQKYVGGSGGKSQPTLSAIGGTRWKKQKESVAESVKDLAGEMLRIRAARESMPGIRYPADTTWQKEFEAEFPYTETDDQLAALGEIKKDMGSSRPMDRLLCGDVGYGKTEVAIRAAFKAVEFGKQVAVLVPTTVLAEQHERTFRSRFADYPFRIESVSRFKTTQQVNEVLAALRKGQVDVIIGTHRLLSKDVKFADLGLVIIDEEQRFGVEHKDKLLSLRMTVDVLTLSATPIPRTLHLSMLGLRDISSLATAPVDRRAVVTEVIPYNTRRIQQALQRELARDGQIFFVHNRVHNIKSVADEVQKLVPDARIVIGHGQMADGELEAVMMKFMQRKADILVSTTIIESGIDIPTANTMFINDADRFGLAELHQLRGRVGRYKHRAYCYMLLPLDRTSTEKAVKRLKAIEEFSMLGAGFKIAMRDLEIRGAGNILGPEQSGHIAAVGYEMYCQLLDTAVKELKNEPTQVASETAIEIGVTGMIPKRYIPSDQRRMEAYRRIALAQTQPDLDRIEVELKQAYGDTLPAATVRLLELAALRVAASILNIRSLTVRGPDVVMRAAPGDAPAIAEKLRAPQMPMSATGRENRPAAPFHVTVLPPRPKEELGEVYFRPPPNYMQPETLLRVLKGRLAEQRIAESKPAVASLGRA